MNNREKRREYFMNFVNGEFDVYAEELFIVGVVNNDYAMEFIKRKIKTFSDITKILDFNISEKYKYDFRYLVTNCQQKISNLLIALNFIAYVEETSQLELLESLSKKSNSRIFKTVINEGQLNNEQTKDINIFFFIASLLNKDFKKLDNESKETLKSYLREATYEGTANYIVDNNMFKEEEFSSIIDKYKLKNGTSLKKVFDIIENIYLKELEKFMVAECIKINTGNVQEMKHKFDNEFDKLADKLVDKFDALSTWKDCQIYRKKSCLESLIDLSSTESNIIMDKYISVNDINMILEDIKFNLDSYYIEKKDIEVSFIDNLFLFVIFNLLEKKNDILYKELVDFENYKVTATKKINTLEDVINQALKEKEFYNINIRNKDNYIKELEDKLIKTQASLNAANNEIESLKEGKEELLQLRELFFKIENTDYNEVIEDNEFVIKDDYKIAVIGGSDNLRVRLKENFPTFIMISPDDITKDLTFLKNMQYIFIHTNMSHSMYYKIIDLIRYNNIDYSYLNEINIDLLKSNILSKLSNRFNN